MRLVGCRKKTVEPVKSASRSRSFSAVNGVSAFISHSRGQSPDLRHPREKRGEPSHCSETRNRIEFLDCRGERVFEGPEGAGLKLLVLRTEVVVVHYRAQVLLENSVSGEKR